MKNPKLALLGLLVLVSTSAAVLGAERFTFRYSRDDKYRYLSTVDEYVYVNRRLVNRVEIVNRIAFSVAEVKGGSGLLRGSFRTSERPWGSTDSYLLTTDYDAEYWRSDRGVYTIADSYYMPVVRNVPVFPDRDLSPGDTWAAPGEERHDFRRAYGIEEPFRIPFTANYTYLGKRDFEGRNLPAFKVQYSIFHRPPPPRSWTSSYPVQVMGSSDQLVYWNPESGQPEYYTENFKIVIELANGVTQEFTGTAEARLIEATLMDRERVEDSVRKEVKRLGIEDATVSRDALGVTISLEDVRFQADSAVLMESEKRKLDKIAEIIKSYPDRDLQITGHTALAGTESARQRLSEERAKAVGDYLASIGLRTPERMVIRGLGATKPVADNATEAGMARNRRVEITILEN